MTGDTIIIAWIIRHPTCNRNKLVIASNLKKKKKIILIVLKFLFLEWNIYGIHINSFKPYSVVFTWDSSLLLLLLSRF
jgi:hypothetical protein